MMFSLFIANVGLNPMEEITLMHLGDQLLFFEASRSIFKPIEIFSKEKKKFF